jgi:hypothetical protein
MASAQSVLVIERILRDRDGVWRQIAEDRDLKPLSGLMLLSSAVGLAVYGAVLGASHGWLQALASAVKLPILFLVTLAICLPTLYLLNLVFGAKLSLRQAVAMVSVAITVMSMLTVAFAPISLFFLITAPDYSFYKLLNVAIMALTAMIGLRFLIVGMRAMNRHQLREEAVPVSPAPAPQPDPAQQPVAAQQPVPAQQPVAVQQTVAAQQPAPASQPAMVFPMLQPVHQSVPHPMALPPGYVPLPPRPAPVPRPPRQASMGLLYVWIVVFGFVGTQLAWTLRPFFGSPGEPFQIFRHIEGNFYVDVVRTLGHLF